MTPAAVPATMHASHGGSDVSPTNSNRAMPAASNSERMYPGSWMSHAYGVSATNEVKAMIHAARRRMAAM